MGDPRILGSDVRLCTNSTGRRWLPLMGRIAATTGVSLALVVSTTSAALADPAPPPQPSSSESATPSELALQSSPPMAPQTAVPSQAPQSQSQLGADVPATWVSAPATDDPAWEPEFTEPRPLQTPTSAWFPTAPETHPVELPVEAPPVEAPALDAPVADAQEPGSPPGADMTQPAPSDPQATAPTQVPEIPVSPPTSSPEVPQGETQDEEAKPEAPEEDIPTQEAPKNEVPKESPKTEEPKREEPKSPAPKKEELKKSAPTKDAPKQEQRNQMPKKQAPTKEAPKKEPGGSPGEKALGVAADLTGIPYVWGGTSTRGFDCSGYVQHAFGRAGVKLPRTAAEQQRATRRVSDPRPGDLVFFGSPAHHVGIYAGNGRMYDAPRTGKTTGLHRIWSKSVTYGRP